MEPGRGGWGKFKFNVNQNENENKNATGEATYGGALRAPLAGSPAFVFGFVFVFVLISVKFVFSFFLPQMVVFYLRAVLATLLNTQRYDRDRYSKRKRFAV